MKLEYYKLLKDKLLLMNKHDMAHTCIKRYKSGKDTWQVRSADLTMVYFVFFIYFNKVYWGC